MENLQARYRVSERRACRVLRFARATHRYKPQRSDDSELRRRIRELAAARPRFGYRRLWVLLRREGRRVNAKKVYRIYREEGLAVYRRQRRKRVSHSRVILPAAAGPHERWSMDFVTDWLESGRRFRALTVVTLPVNVP